MRKQARALRRAGRFGDNRLVHINERELGYLTSIWGEPSTNPVTGLPEFFDWGGIASWLAPAIVSGGAEALGGAGTLGSIGSFLGAGADWAPTLGGALLGAGTGALTQGLQGKDALMGALGGGLLGGAVPTVGSALGFKELATPWNVPTLFGGEGVAGALGLGGAQEAFGPPNPASAASGLVEGGSGATGPVYGPGQPPSLPGAGGGGTASSALGWLTKNPAAALMALSTLGALATSKNQPQAPPQQPQRPSYTLPNIRLNRTRNTQTSGFKPGEYNFYTDNQTPDQGYADGGPTDGSGGNMQGYIQGPGDGRDDLIPAQLSNDEYVMTAEDMALLGNGSPSAGADKMDQFRVNLRKHKGAALARGHISPDAKPVEGYL